MPDGATSPPLTRPRPFVVAGLAFALLGACLATIPFAREPTRGTEVILPAYAAASFVLELMTAVLLLALFRVRRSPALLILACGYLYSGFLMPGWLLTFPDVFAGLGVDAGPQATAAIAAARRLGFAVFVLGYAFAPDRGGSLLGSRRASLRGIALTVLLAALVLGAVLWARDSLPPFMRTRTEVNPLWAVVPYVALTLYAIGLAALLRRRGALDPWICLVLFSLVIELVLLSFVSGGTRLSLGWWAGRLYGLVAAGIVLLVLLSDTTAVYARLAQSLAAARRGRENRLTAMEALSATIAHEINQPLASMITNADAGLRWLLRPEPQRDRVEAALRRIVADGHRANKIVTGIRTMFMKGAQERVPFDVNGVIREAAAAAAEEARLAGVTMELSLAPQMAMVIGNAVQLRQVVSNLIDNAIDAMRAEGLRQRHLILRSRCTEQEEVEFVVEDTGVGLPPGMEELVFEPFVSTKAEGMGMGLMFCRSVVEAHGGHLRVSANRPRGTIFRVVLPEARGLAGQPEPGA